MRPSEIPRPQVQRCLPFERFLALAQQVLISACWGSFGLRIETRYNLDDLGEVNRRQIQIVQVGICSLERWQRPLLG